MGRNITNLIFPFSLSAAAFGLWVLVGLCSPAPLLAQNPMKAPQMPQPARKAPPEPGLGATLGLGLVRGFQQVISPADGPRSPSYPTGSAYGVQVLEEEGFFWGVLMIGDRLFHEADLPLGPKVWVHGVERYYDPPLYNRYWRE